MDRLLEDAISAPPCLLFDQSSEDKTFCTTYLHHLFEENIVSSSSQLFESFALECHLACFALTNSAYEETASPRASSQDLLPTSIVMARTIQDQPSQKPLRVLFDSGGTCSLINRRALPAGATPSRMVGRQMAQTASGSFDCLHSVRAKDLIFPEFSKSIQVEMLPLIVFDQPDCKYDVIIGRDFLLPNEFDLSYSKKTMEWYGRSVPMKTIDQQCYFLADDDNDNNDTELMATNILEAKYDQASIDEVIQQQSHLTDDEKQALRGALTGHDRLFSGKLGKYTKRKIHLDVRDSTPIHCKPYAVPRTHHTVFRKELDRLCEVDVLERCGASEHAYPTFIIPKKDGRVRCVSDFRKLNNNLRRKIYSLPKIQDILQRRSGYRYFTKIDISMQYYTFELDDESSWLCVINTPFGKFRYKRLPMGIKQSPDIAQEIMEEVLQGLNDIEVYIDDIGIFSNDLNSHIASIQQVLTRLGENGFTVNPLKCEWDVTETDWLGYWLTPSGLKPWNKKIQAICRLEAPKTIKQLRSFIGAVNYYRDMWQKRAHYLAPLTSLTGANTFVWQPVHQRAFEQLKAMILQDALLAYPDHNSPFTIFTDASDLQLGSVILQNNRPVAYYSRKLNSAQRNYTTIEKELLSIVETLREFRSMLLGAKIDIHTDHKNLTYSNFNTQRVLRWRLYVEEFHPTFHYIRKR